MKKYILNSLFILLFHSGIFCQSQTVGLFLNDSLSYNGYTLMMPIDGFTTYLIDNCGREINRWVSEYKIGSSAYLLPNGKLLRTGRINGAVHHGGGTGGLLEWYNWEGEVIWDYEFVVDSVYHQHHDIEPMPNGNILILAWGYRTREEAIEAGRNPMTTGNSFWPTQVIEVEPMLEADSVHVVWEWHLWDHIIQDFDSTKTNYGVVTEYPELMDINAGGGTDWMHANSIDYNSGLDQIIINARNTHEFFVIDHSTTTEEAAGHTGGNSGKGGDLLYRWGNPQIYDRGTEGNRVFYFQHDAHWIPEGMPDGGKIMVFNNGLQRPGGNYSSIEVIDPPVDATGNYNIEADVAYLPDDSYWRYTTDSLFDFFSDGISGAQQLSNGNTLICEGVFGEVFEVTPEEEVVWYYVNPMSSSGALPQGMNNAKSVFRAHRYEVDYEGFDGKDLTPGAPMELDPLPFDCTIYENDPITGIEQTYGQGVIRVYPSFAESVVYVENTSGKEVLLHVFDLTGRQILQKKWVDISFEIDVSDWHQGVYFVSFFDVGKRQIITKKIIKI